MSVQTCVTFCFLWNPKWDILKNIGNQMILGPIDFHNTKKTTKTWKSIGPVYQLYL